MGGIHTLLTAVNRTWSYEVDRNQFVYAVSIPGPASKSALKREPIPTPWSRGRLTYVQPVDWRAAIVRL